MTPAHISACGRLMRLRSRSSWKAAARHDHSHPKAHPGTSPASSRDLTAGTEYRYRLNEGQAFPDPASRFAAARRSWTVGRRGSSRVQLEALAGWTGIAPDRSRHLRAARRHLHPGGHVCRRRRSTRVAGAPRRHRDRADAGRRFPGPLELGLRRRVALCAGALLRIAGRPAASRRSRSRPRAGRRPRRRLQPPRPRRELPAGVQPTLLHRPSPHPVGLGAQSRSAAQPRGQKRFSSRTRPTGFTSFASTACGSTPRTRSSTTARVISSQSWPRRCAQSARRPARVDLRRGSSQSGRPSQAGIRRRLGAGRRVGRRPAPSAAPPRRRETSRATTPISTAQPRTSHARYDKAGSIPDSRRAGAASRGAPTPRASRRSVLSSACRITIR